MVQKARYHHGNLRAALVDAAFELAAEGGPDAIVVREASRRVGVSHNAAYRHFPDRDSLLRAVAERCMRRLASLMEELIDQVEPDDRSAAAARARLSAVGEAYIRFAVQHPGLFRTAFSVPPTLGWFGPGEGVGTAGLDPYALLGAQLDGMVSAGALPPQRRPGAEVVAWSAVHGLSMLLLEGPLRELSPAQRDESMHSLLKTVVRGLVAQG
jgi:AcrR family transcriptional regulator